MLSTSRRHFLYMVGGVGSGAVLGSRLIAASGDNPESIVWQSDSADQTAIATRKGRAFGTTMSVSLAHPDRAVARRAIGAAFEKLELIESLLSLFRPDSQLSQLNRHCQLAAPHPLFVQMLLKANATSQETNGAFDMTVQPLWELFAEANLSGMLPTDNEIRHVLKYVDCKMVDIKRDRVRLLKTGMAVTLNGIAQGFAADCVRSTLAQLGVRNALIDTGEIGALGRKHSDTPWRVGIQHPRRPDAFIHTADLSDRCLATSGDYATVFGEGFRNHHLFDPRTGRSPAEFASVSILAPSAVQADALSTAVFVMGSKAGLELIKAQQDCDALLVLKSGHIVRTNGFPCSG